MANGLTDREAEILGKTPQEIRDLLGDPVKVAAWKTVDSPPELTAAEVEAFLATQLGEIWVYTNGRVHFSRTNIAARVDEDVTKHLGDADLLIV